ncbi:MAG: shikimate dehydrogenase, partial [Lachnospiraceae bacterium]|nr:shikimate dehydrogenase [Lachnospiraceae bacterium]
MRIDGKTKTYGLFGNPVEHTMSPLIHNTLAQKLGHNLVYVPFRVEEDQIQSAVRAVRSLQLGGVNVTVPHKSAVMDCLDETDLLAKKIGAVNTIVHKNGRLKGYNTDMPGLYRAMRSEGIEVEDKHILILGAGGAARAVAMLCATYGARRIYILNRTKEKAA